MTQPSIPAAAGPVAPAEPAPGNQLPAALPAYSIPELRLLARRVLPRGLFEYVDRGTDDESALRVLRAAIDEVRLEPRVLIDVSSRSSRTDFFGQPSALPMALAPTGAAGLLWFDGEIALARAARSAGIPFTLSTASIISMERVAAEAGGRLWFQLYMWPQRELSLELVARARQCNYEALMVTVDTPVAPFREYNKRNGFSLPMRITGRNAVDVALHPRWFLKVFARYWLRSGIPTLENYPASLRKRLDQSQTPPKCDSLSWEDLRDLRRRWDGPLVVKGILRPDDAQKARDCGVDAIVVSNHGGRNLDATVPPIKVLPRVVERVGGAMDVFVDGGFNRGGDIAKALALGAKGVLIGRAPLWGLAAGGEAGARQALQILRDEFDRVLAFTGSPSVAALDRSLLHPERD